MVQLSLEASECNNPRLRASVLNFIWLARDLVPGVVPWPLMDFYFFSASPDLGLRFLPTSTKLLADDNAPT